MSNIHEYVIFDRAVVDPILSMTWPALETSRPGWGQWGSAEDFLVDYGLAQEHVARVREIIARKTVRETVRLSDTPFLFLYALLDEKGLSAGSINIEKGNYKYADEILSCAASGYLRGILSLALLTAAYRLHASCTAPGSVLPPDLAAIIASQPAPRPMLPTFPDLLQEGSDGLGMSDARRFIAFMIRAWDENWPLFMPQQEQKTTSRRKIRSCQIAKEIVQVVRAPLAKPCIYRWFEC